MAKTIVPIDTNLFMAKINYRAAIETLRDNNKRFIKMMKLRNANNILLIRS